MYTVPQFFSPFSPFSPSIPDARDHTIHIIQSPSGLLCSNRYVETLLMLQAKVWHPNQIPLPPYAFDPFKYRLEKKI